jgi:cytosolic prostaglandin-E synthase
MKLMKKEKEEEFWPRLLLDKALERINVKVDWDRFIDEDDDQGDGFDLSNLDGAFQMGVGLSD